jgi:hypothetical protein
MEDSGFVGYHEAGSIPEELFIIYLFHLVARGAIAWPGVDFFFLLLVFWLHKLVFNKSFCSWQKSNGSQLLNTMQCSAYL